MSSSHRRLSAAAALSLLGAAVLAGYVFRHELLRVLVGAAGVRLAWGYLKHRCGIRPRRGKSLWEVGFGTLAGYLLGRRRGAETHPCLQCGAPIGHPSRAVYCSPACRKYAALERAETERRAERLAAFGDVPEGFGA